MSVDVGHSVTLSVPPLVSVIVRSMGRPELVVALESIARQVYPSIETVIVDATGGGHPPLPSFSRSRGHVVRMVGGDRRLPRAHAANVGLLAAHGEWLCFLDDDDFYDSHFVSAMLAAAADHPAALIVYGRAKQLRMDGQVDRLFGLPFNRALMHYGPLFPWSAALIRRKVIDLGCRFDETLDVCEDRDFLAQVAQHSNFAFVPVVGFSYRAYLGTSGTAHVNRDVANTIRFESLLRAKEAGAGAYHTWRSTRLCMRAIGAYHTGDRVRSRDLFEALLQEYPDDPNGLHGLARIELDQGLFGQAETLVNRAIDINPTAAEYRLTRAMILERLRRRQDAAQEAVLAANEPVLRSTVEEFLRRLGPLDTMDLVAKVPSRRDAPVVSRLGPCPCGSGKRYKQCCGYSAAERALSQADRALQQARAWFVRGEAFRAKALIDTLAPADTSNPDLSLSAGEICFELGNFEQAYAFLDRAVKLESSPRTSRLLGACCDFLWQDRARDSAHAMVLSLREHIESRVIAHSSPAPGPIHVLGATRTISGSENQAVSLYRMLAPHADVRLWSATSALERHYPELPIEVLDPASGVFPGSGTLVLAGHYSDCGDWWREAAFERVVIWVSRDLPEELVHRLADIEEITQAVRIDFTHPSHLSRDLFGLPGEVEYPLVDVARFARTTPRRSDGSRLNIGRHSRDDRLRHHPDDPALYRQLVARGHRMRLLGGTRLQAAFSGDPAASAVELLSTGSQDARDFLSGLDCFIYRKHPQLFEPCGTCILEAMSMALPVILFRQGVGAVELIEHGQDGFLVETEAEALACIDQLAADIELRAAIGAAARRKVTALMQDQRTRILTYYLGSAYAASGFSSIPLVASV